MYKKIYNYDPNKVLRIGLIKTFDEQTGRIKYEWTDGPTGTSRETRWSSPVVGDGWGLIYGPVKDQQLLIDTRSEGRMEVVGMVPKSYRKLSEFLGGIKPGEIGLLSLSGSSIYFDEDGSIDIQSPFGGGGRIFFDPSNGIMNFEALTTKTEWGGVTEEKGILFRSVIVPEIEQGIERTITARNLTGLTDESLVPEPIVDTGTDTEKATGICSKIAENTGDIDVDGEVVTPVHKIASGTILDDTGKELYQSHQDIDLTTGALSPKIVNKVIGQDEYNDSGQSFQMDKNGNYIIKNANIIIDAKTNKIELQLGSLAGIMTDMSLFLNGIGRFVGDDMRIIGNSTAIGVTANQEPLVLGNKLESLLNGFINKFNGFIDDFNNFLNVFNTHTHGDPLSGTTTGPSGVGLSSTNQQITTMGTTEKTSNVTGS